MLQTPNFSKKKYKFFNHDSFNQGIKRKKASTEKQPNYNCYFLLIFSGIHVSDTTEGTTVDLSAWIGPMIVTLMALIVIMVCCCFFRIDPSAPHSEELDAFR